MELVKPHKLANIFILSLLGYMYLADHGSADHVFQRIHALPAPLSGMIPSHFFFPGLDGQPLPTTPSTKLVRAGQLSKMKDGA